MITELLEDLLLSLENSSVSEIEYEKNGIRMRLVRRVDCGNATPHVPGQPNGAHHSKTATQGGKTHSICANMHGIFYRSSSPEEPPFVEVGQQVEAGQQIAVLEAMKMLHEFEADISGTLTKVLVEDGSAVEPGTALFILERLDV